MGLSAGEWMIDLCVCVCACKDVFVLAWPCDSSWNERMYFLSSLFTYSTVCLLACYATLKTCHINSSSQREPASCRALVHSQSWQSAEHAENQSTRNHVVSWAKREIFKAKITPNKTALKQTLPEHAGVETPLSCCFKCDINPLMFPPKYPSLKGKRTSFL